MSIATLNSTQVTHIEAELDAQLIANDIRTQRLIEKNKAHSSAGHINTPIYSLNKYEVIILGALIGGIITALAVNIIFGLGAALIALLSGGIVGGGLGAFADRSWSINICKKQEIIKTQN